MNPTLLTVNLGRVTARTNPRLLPTAIDKHPHDGPIQVRDPGSRAHGLGSGLVGDEIGDHRHHGGDGQAVYTFAREELDEWGRVLGRELPNGMFGENLTTRDLVVSDAVIGERWRVGPEVVLQVSGPRIPCGRFREHMAVKGWLKTFTRAGRSGAYLSVVTPGTIRAGDEIAVVHRPDHHVTTSEAFRALTLQPETLPRLLAAGDDLPPELSEMARAGQAYSIG